MSCPLSRPGIPTFVSRSMQASDLYAIDSRLARPCRMCFQCILAAGSKRGFKSATASDFYGMTAHGALLNDGSLDIDDIDAFCEEVDAELSSHDSESDGADEATATALLVWRFNEAGITGTAYAAVIGETHPDDAIDSELSASYPQPDDTEQDSKFLRKNSRRKRSRRKL